MGGKLTIAALRRQAVLGSLGRPTTLARAISGAGFVQAEPIRAPVRALVFLGYPLHPAGRPDALRADHLPQVRVPMLFLQGTRDALCDLDRLRPILDELPQALTA